MVVIIIAGQGVLVWALLRKSASTLEAIGWITGAVVPLVGFLYNQLQKRSLRVFLLTNKIRSLFSSRILTWSLSANLRKQNLTPDVLEGITRELLEDNKGHAKIKVKQVSRNDSIIEIDPGPTIDLAYTPGSFTADIDEDEDKWPYVQVTIRNYRVGYRQADHVIRHEILPVLETIANVTQAVESKYTFNIEFDKERNPFFGLYVAQLPPEIVSKFFIRLTVDNYGPNSTVLVSESNVSINTRTQRALQNLALEFLTFDPNLQEHLRRA
jgi:hypothetical protein